MSTQPPTMDSQNGQILTTDPLLEALMEKLTQEGIEPHRLVVVLLTGAEMIFGEILELVDMPESFWEDSFWIKNPKRLTRHSFQNRSTGEIVSEVIFSDFDMIREGNIEVRPQGMVQLKYCDAQTRHNYYSAYLNFLEGRRIARAKDAGLDLTGRINPNLLKHTK